MIAGAAKIDIIPRGNVWMDGMIRGHKSTGIHDRIFARALVLGSDDSMEHACALISVEVCGIRGSDAHLMRESIARETGIPPEHIVIAATHTHSGPATIGFFNPVEDGYIGELHEKITEVTRDAARNTGPVAVGFASGAENTISHYRRLLAEDGHVVMNWEQYPAEKIIGPLGETDSEVGIVKFADAGNPGTARCLLFNHAGHPNVLSGDNYRISGDYPGYAAHLLENEYGCTALFLNGAQGTMDIDGLRDRDTEGVERTGSALAAAVAETACRIDLSQDLRIRTGHVRYTLPPRMITADELSWAEQVIAATGGAVRTMADGVGDDYKALLFKRLHEQENRDIPAEHTCIAIGDCALISFPGELFTEIGQRIKRESPFSYTYIIGLANGEIGYVPTAKAIGEGGYAVETREVCDNAEEIIVSHCLELLNRVYGT
ncbi:neutral/alkaline non-lysosomal ceramidase N-terminal domain-containing protein [bacterium]|nr:neutral/alkaline non-lysosomal ceramidase N-terminal domain-containing protein [bacterium]